MSDKKKKKILSYDELKTKFSELYDELGNIDKNNKTYKMVTQELNDGSIKSANSYEDSILSMESELKKLKKIEEPKKEKKRTDTNVDIFADPNDPNATPDNTPYMYKSKKQSWFSKFRYKFRVIRKTLAYKLSMLLLFVTFVFFLVFALVSSYYIGPLTTISCTRSSYDSHIITYNNLNLTQYYIVSNTDGEINYLDRDYLSSQIEDAGSTDRYASTFQTYFQSSGYTCLTATNLKWYHFQKIF